jgi:transcriptional regulator with XRE-family HTH domain
MYPNLKLQIFKRGMRQNYLAQVLGINEAILSKIIHGYHEPSVAMRKSLADFLEAGEDWLFEKYETQRVGNGSSRSTAPASIGAEREDGES